MRIAILGPLEITGADGATVAVGGARLRALLTRLAVDAGRPVAIESLAGALWPERAPRNPAPALHSLVSRLRRALPAGAAVVPGGGWYRLDVPPETVDAHRFERLARDGARALRAEGPEPAGRLLRAALDLWRGEPLADAAGAPYAEAVAARLGELRLTCVEDRLTADLAAGVDPAGLVAELRELTAAHPLRERLRGLLIEALRATGRDAEALAGYEEFRRLLADELGADPGPELRRAHLGLLRAEPATRPVPRGDLRAPVTAFFGREAERERIRERFARGRLVTLVGPGGAGKTRLATVAAGELAAEAAGGVWLVELAAVTDPDEVPRAVARVLGGPQAGPPGATDPVTALVRALAPAGTLLVLDNLEHVLDTAARLAGELLARCPRLRVLATSREPLGIPGEALCPVPPLPLPEPGAPAAGSPAVRLFADRAAAVSPAFARDWDTGDEATRKRVTAVCRALDGLPLALELAAARLRTMSLETLTTRLAAPTGDATPDALSGDVTDRVTDRVTYGGIDPVAEGVTYGATGDVTGRMIMTGRRAGAADDRLGLLTGGRTAPSRHRTLRAVMAWSWDLLDADERLQADRLAVFPASFGPEQAARLGVPWETLDALVDRSLLQVDGGRYRMLETIRRYGLERLAGAGRLDRARADHAAGFLELAERAAPHLRGAGELPWLRVLAAERDSLLAALRFARETGDASAAVRLAAPQGLVWAMHEGHGVAAERLAAALRVPGEAPPEARVSAAEAPPEVRLSATAECLLHAVLADRKELAAHLPRPPDLPEHPAAAMAGALRALIAKDPAAGAAALDRRPPPADPWWRGMLALTRSMLSGNLGDVRLLRADLADAIAGFRAAGERWWLATALTYLAMAGSMAGDLSGSAASLEESVRLMRELGAPGGFQRAQLARVRMCAGEREAARAELLALLDDRAGPGPAPAVRAALADLARYEGDLAQASRQLDLAARDLGEAASSDAYLRSALGFLAVDLGDLAGAGTQLRDALALAVRMPDLPMAARVAVGAALLLSGRADPRGAARLLGAAAVLRGGPDEHDPDVARAAAGLRRALGDDGYRAEYAAGRALTGGDALALVAARLGAPADSRM